MEELSSSGSSGEKSPPDSERSLRGITLLEDQDEATIRRLEEICRWHAYSEGEQIFDRSDTSGDVYFIVKGSVRGVDYGESGQEVAFVDSRAGELIGEFSAIDGEARAATVHALEDSVLAVVPGDVFVSFMCAHRDVANRMLRHLARTIRSLDDRIIDLSSTTAVQRVYGELLELAKPDPMNPRRRIIDSMPHHKEIAAWAGATPETVARAIGQLIDANVVKRRFKTLHILDPKRLQALVDAS